MRVSVIVPTFNRAPSLVRALESILAQSMGDFEVVIVDDASSDGTAAAVERLGSERLRYLRHEETRGGSAARNTGIHAARAELIAFLDDDDEWLPRKLERQLNVLDTVASDVAVVHCGFEKVSDVTGDVIESRIPTDRNLTPLDFLRSTRFATSVAVIRRQCFDEVGLFDESLPGTQDRDLWIRVSRHFRFAHVSEVLVRHHIHGEQITSTLSIKIEAKQRMLAKYAVDLREHPAILAYDLWRLGLLCCAAGRRQEGRRYFWKAVRAAPRSEWPAGVLRDLLRSLVSSRSTCEREARRSFNHVDGVPQYY